MTTATTERTLGTLLPVADNLKDLTADWHLWKGWADRAVVRAQGQDQWVAVVPMLFTWALIVGYRDSPWSYYDRWCYDSLEIAVVAATAWNGRGEPYGWHRHPTSGRRRPDGDHTQEYLNP